MEIHYDNPKFKADIVDNSGLRIFLTDQLREYDTGVIMVGHEITPFMIIPPNEEWETTAHCTPSCTEEV